MQGCQSGSKCPIPPATCPTPHANGQNYVLLAAVTPPALLAVELAVARVDEARGVQRRELGPAQQADVVLGSMEGAWATSHTHGRATLHARRPRR
jgi:hypothetical protein